MSVFRQLALVVFLSVIGWVNYASGDTPKWLVTPRISPDGTQIAFSYQGVLYVVPANGGLARALTTGKDYAAHPVWSPKGDKIAFASDRFGNFDIFTINVDGTNLRRITLLSASEIPQSFTPNGDSIVYAASYLGSNTSAAFVGRWNNPLYRVSVNGGAEKLLLPAPAQNVSYAPDGKSFIFEQRTSVENEFRKHHTSSASRDIWMYTPATRSLTTIVKRPGEDRCPRFAPDGKSFYFLSERDGGSFNVYEQPVSGGEAVRITQFEKLPVRALSVANNGKFCFSYDGEIYTMMKGSSPEKLKVDVVRPDDEMKERLLIFRGGADDGTISPNGKEVAFVVRGDVYVTFTKYNDTKRITNTPEQERSVSFSPDGRSIVYAGERNGSWNLYISKIVHPEDKYFSFATEVEEEVLLANEHQTFQPVFSPDGKEVAFLEDRTKLKVINLATKAVREITDGSKNYSYADGDMHFEWSPDSKWFVLAYNDKHRWPNSDIGIVSAAGGAPITNLTLSGYTDTNPRFMMGGDMIIWTSDRNGLRSHASWGAQNDIYAFFTTKEAFDKFNLTKSEYEVLKETESDAKKDDKDKKNKAKKDDKEEVKALKIDLNRVEDRIVRLTIHSSDLSDAVVTPDGESLYYLCRFEGRYNLWKTDLRKNETKKVLDLNSGAGSIALDKKGENMLVVAGSKMVAIEVKGEKQTNVSFIAPFEWRQKEERKYIFNHAWQQVVDKFYRTDLHGVDWKFYKEAYGKFLPYITNNYDFSDLLSELLGELNASHTGSGYRHVAKADAWSTSSLGVFFDRNFKGQGVKVTEVIATAPFDQADSKLRAGDVITHIDGEVVADYGELPRLLNHKAGERTRVTFTHAGATVNEVVKPISLGSLREILYERWIEQRRHEVDSLSNGRLGYVHIRAMDAGSFRTIYSELFGRYNDREGVVIDTRYNGGGHLHEDIEVLFSGKKYLDQVPREQWVGEQPRKRWKKPSIMLMSEANYSNAHGTPWVYKTLGIGKLVGMPVPGTMTSVWWETQIDPSIYFGVPIVGYIDATDHYLENQQLNPDIEVSLDYLRLEQGHDSQIERAVVELLKDCDVVKATSPWTTIDKKYDKK